MHFKGNLARKEAPSSDNINFVLSWLIENNLFCAEICKDINTNAARNQFFITCLFV
jgi:hypothetical protein